MEGYEQSEVGSVTVAVEHDPEDNRAMLRMTSRRGAMAMYMTPKQTAQVIAMLQRMQARQATDGEEVLVGVENEAV